MLRHSKRSPETRCQQAGSRSKGRVDRTQEVAGSSPASFMKPPQIGGFSLGNERMANIQALGPRCPQILRRNELACRRCRVDAPDPKVAASRATALTRAVHGPGCATDPSSHWVTAVSPYATWRDLGRLAEQLRYRRKPPIASGLFKPSGGLESQTPSLPWRSLGNRSQPSATGRSPRQRYSPV
jgi:hypothetical protein